MSGWAQLAAERAMEKAAAGERDDDDADEAVELSGVAKALAAAEVEARGRESGARRASPPPARFEYEVVELEGRRMEPASEWAATLAAYAADGWRVVSIVGEPGEYVRAVLERPAANGGGA